MRVICIIPARLQSKRFPRKILSYLGQKPLLQWVWEAACACSQFDEVAFAIDHRETAELINTFRGNYFMTSESCQSGTERLVELMNSKQLKADIWVNWQGDEPLVNCEMIDDLLQTVNDKGSDIWTLKKKIEHEEEIANPHVVKIVTDLEGKALYFSRSPIPYSRESKPLYYKHIGLYAFTNEALRHIHAMPPSPLEQSECLEQLRFVERGLTLKVHETTHETRGIDIPQDLIAAQSSISSPDRSIRIVGHNH